METRDLTCICCPMGCPLEVTLEDGKCISVTGNRCKRGAAYGEEETVRPMRVLTTTVRHQSGKMISVKTKTSIPKGKLMDAAKEVAKVTVSGSVAIGDVIVKDLAGTGVALVATQAMN